jgi:hypothetical protein
MRRTDFRFENSAIKVIADRSYQEVKLSGLTVGPFEEGNEYEVYYWIAKELVKAGLAHFREEDGIDATKLYKIQWKERIQVAGQISELPENFYPKLRRYLANLKSELKNEPERLQEYERAKHLAWDIVSSRMKKIVSLSTGPIQGEHVLGKMAQEERLIYERLSHIIQEWREQILEHHTEE